MKEPTPVNNEFVKGGKGAPTMDAPKAGEPDRPALAVKVPKTSENGERAGVGEFNESTVSKTVKGSAAPGTGEALVGSSRSQMRAAAARIIKSDPNHPLKFLLEKSGKFKSQKGLTHAELVDRPDIVQMGHIASNKLGGTERLMLQGAWENQWNNLTVENPHIGGAVLEQGAIDIGGIAVDIKTATFWEEIGWLKPGTVSGAAKITD